MSAELVSEQTRAKIAQIAALDQAIDKADLNHDWKAKEALLTELQSDDNAKFLDLSYHFCQAIYEEQRNNRRAAHSALANAVEIVQARLSNALKCRSSEQNSAESAQLVIGTLLDQSVLTFDAVTAELAARLATRTATVNLFSKYDDSPLTFQDYLTLEPEKQKAFVLLGFAHYAFSIANLCGADRELNEVVEKHYGAPPYVMAVKACTAVIQDAFNRITRTAPYEDKLAAGLYLEMHLADAVKADDLLLKFVDGHFSYLPTLSKAAHDSNNNDAAAHLINAAVARCELIGTPADSEALQTECRQILNRAIRSEEPFAALTAAIALRTEEQRIHAVLNIARSFLVTWHGLEKYFNVFAPNLELIQKAATYLRILVTGDLQLGSHYMVASSDPGEIFGIHSRPFKPRPQLVLPIVFGHLLRFHDSWSHEPEVIWADIMERFDDRNKLKIMIRPMSEDVSEGPVVQSVALEAIAAISAMRGAEVRKYQLELLKLLERGQIEVHYNTWGTAKTDWRGKTKPTKHYFRQGIPSPLRDEYRNHDSIDGKRMTLTVLSALDQCGTDELMRTLRASVRSE